MSAARDISHMLAERIDSLALCILGKPTHRYPSEWRYGRRGSLSIVIRGDKRGQFFNHERGEGGDALELVRRVNGGSISDAMRWATRWLGNCSSSSHLQLPAKSISLKIAVSEPDSAERIKSALAIWHETVPLIGTAAEEYLGIRGIVPPSEVVDLRFHPNCPAAEGRRLPAMVAVMRDIKTNEPRAIHRTFLKHDGAGKNAYGKMMLGAARGAVIKLSDEADVTLGLGLAEGIENALSLLVYGWWPVWAAGSAGAIRIFPVLYGIETLTIFSDADDGGVGIAAARSCAIRWQTAGRNVEIHKPPAGTDWNDVARSIAS
jgi:putative DNA primase/helicase